MYLQTITIALFIGMIAFAIYLIWDLNRDVIKFYKAVRRRDVRETETLT